MNFNSVVKIFAKVGTDLLFRDLNSQIDKKENKCNFMTLIKYLKREIWSNLLTFTFYEIIFLINLRNKNLIFWINKSENRKSAIIIIK